MTPQEWDAKRATLTGPQMKPLTAFVRQIRQDRLSEDYIPDFDPDDGGVNAEVLFVLEAPGPKAVTTGFVSRDNPAHDQLLSLIRNGLTLTPGARRQTAAALRRLRLARESADYRPGNQRAIR